MSRRKYWCVLDKVCVSVEKSQYFTHLSRRNYDLYKTDPNEHRQPFGEDKKE